MYNISTPTNSQHDCGSFFERYSPFLPGVFTASDREPETYFRESSLLFWAIVATGARHLADNKSIYALAVQEIKNDLFQPIFHITNPIPVIQASLILCLWPLPVDTMWKDPSHAFAGAAHFLAVQNGLFVTGHEQDFARTRTSVTPELKDFRARLWLNCCLIFQG